MASSTSFDSGYNPNLISQSDTAGDTDNSHLLNAYLTGFASGVTDQVTSVFKKDSVALVTAENERASYQAIDPAAGRIERLAVNNNSQLASAFREMLHTATPGDLAYSTNYQQFAHRYSDTVSIAQNSQKPAEVASTGNDMPTPQVMQQIQTDLVKAGQLLQKGDIEGGKAAYREAIDLADKNYNAKANVEQIRQLQSILKIGSYNGKELTEQERMQVSQELFQRFAAATLPYQLRSGSTLKDHAGYATVLRQSEQNETAETAYKDAVKAADAMPIAEMKQQIELIANEMGKTNNSQYQDFLSSFSKNLLGGKDENGNEVPGTIKYPISARKDLIEFYVRPNLQQDGSAIMAGTDSKGTPRFAPDSSVVFKPELAAKVADEVQAKYKELYNIDVDKDPSKDVEFAVFRATIDNNLPAELRKHRDEKSYESDSNWSNAAAMGVGLAATALLAKFGAGKLITRLLPAALEESAIVGKVGGAAKVSEFMAAGTLASITRNQMMTNAFHRDDETVGMSIANGFAATFAAKALYTAPKFIADKAFLRGFTAEATTARATSLIGPDGAAQLAKLKELQPGLAVPKDITTFEQWAKVVSPSERAKAIELIAGKLEKTPLTTRFNLVNTITGQPFRSAETLTAGGIGMRRLAANAIGFGTVNTVVDAADGYSRLWPKILSGDATDNDGNKIAPTFENMVIKPIYKSPMDNSFASGVLLAPFIGKPGELVTKPWVWSQVNPMRKNTIIGKIGAGIGLPFTTIQLGMEAAPKYIFRNGAANSDLGGALANTIQTKLWQTWNADGSGGAVEYLDEKIKRDQEKLTDRKLTQPKK